MNIFKKLLLMILGIILQATVFNWFEFQNVKPDLLLIIVISVAMVRTPEESTSFGFFMGLFEDILFGGVLGMNAFIKTIIGYIVGVFNKFYDISIVTQIAIVFISTLLQGVLAYLILNIFQYNIFWKTNFLYIIFPETIYNFFLIFLFFTKIKNFIGKEVSI